MDQQFLQVKIERLLVRFYLIFSCITFCNIAISQTDISKLQLQQRTAIDTIKKASDLETLTQEIEKKAGEIHKQALKLMAEISVLQTDPVKNKAMIDNKIAQLDQLQKKSGILDLQQKHKQEQLAVASKIAAHQTIQQTEKQIKQLIPAAIRAKSLIPAAQAK
jgi:hypothetical protein